jgi:3-hydroxyacyl-CoA dehydrogenase/enoyl-CoA hydratase/carnithine racemase
MSHANAFTLSEPEPYIAVLTFDLPGKGANILSQPVLAELASHLDELEKRTDLAGLIIRSGKPGNFIAGADIREFAASLDIPKEKIVEMCQRGQRLFRRLSSGAFVTVAAIDGICVGGGCELALWCDRRVASGDPKTQIGLPEVKLGLFPGWGGTARLPRIVGLGNAVEMITGGESIDARASALMGLADDVVPADRLLDAAIRVVRHDHATGEYRQLREKRKGPVAVNETELAFLGLTASGYIQQQTKGNYPAPLAALEILLGGATVDVDTACQMEAEGMANLFGTPVNAALINVFFLSDRNKKDPGVDDRAVSPREIRSLAVVGAGIMGSGIATATVRRDIPVTINDAAADALTKATQAILEEVAYDKQKKGPDVQRAVRYAPLVNGTTNDREVAACDLVIEAIVENMQIKRQLYARLEPQMRPDAILASNTSTIPITKLAEGLTRPERFCGIHFFNPVRKMPLVEVIRGAKTSDETVVTAVAFAKRIGKSPIVVNDGPGFLVNRLLLPYMNEALELILDGVPIDAIEKAARKFGMPMGPITLFDVVGLDTAVYAGRVLYEAFPDRIVVSPLVPTLVKAGRLGQKTGSGFFKYSGKSEKGEVDPALDALLTPLLRGGPKLSPDQLTHRLFLPMLVEATRMLAEKIVRDVRDVDLGLIYGIGFPPFRGGLLFWADTLGAKQVVELLKPYVALGPRFQPTPMLLEMARDGSRFYRS